MIPIIPVVAVVGIGLAVRHVLTKNNVNPIIATLSGGLVAFIAFDPMKSGMSSIGIPMSIASARALARNVKEDGLIKGWNAN